MKFVLKETKGEKIENKQRRTMLFMAQRSDKDYIIEKHTFYSVYYY